MQIATRRQKITAFLCAMVLALGLCTLVPVFAHAEGDVASTPANDVVAGKVGTTSSEAKTAAVEAQSAATQTGEVTAPTVDATKAELVDTSVKYGYDETKASTYTLISGKETASYEDFQRITESAVSSLNNKASLNAPAEIVRTENTADGYVAWFQSFRSLTQGAANWNAYLGEAKATALDLQVYNAEIALSDIVMTFGSNDIYSDIKFVFNDVTIASDRNAYWGNSQADPNWNDDGYFHFRAKRSASMIFTNCDLLQNVQRGSVGGEQGNPVDLTFISCNFNGDRVINAFERDKRAGRDPLLVAENGLVEGWDPNHIIENSYFGTNIHDLTITNCVNLRYVNANGSGALSIEGSSFVSSRDALEGENLGGLVAFSNGFSSFIFKNNALIFEVDEKTANKPLYVQAFEGIGFLSFKSRDYFYARPDLGISGVDAQTFGNESNWYNPVDGANVMVNVVKSENNLLLLYVAYTPNPDIPVTTPEDEKTPDDEGDEGDEGDDVPTVPTPTVPEVPADDPVIEPELPVEPIPAVVPVVTPVLIPAVAVPAAAPAPVAAAAPAPATPAAVLVAIPADAAPLAEPQAIADDATPMSASNSWALLNLLLTILAVIESLALLFTFFTRKKEEEDEEEAPRKRTALRLGSVIVAIVAVVVFILTEDMSNPYVLTDQWTLLMLAIALVQTVVTMLSKKKYETQESAE